MGIWLNKVNVNCAKSEEIDLVLHSILHEAVSTRTIQKIIDGHRSSSGVKTSSVINGWFDDNGSHNMAA